MSDKSGAHNALPQLHAQSQCPERSTTPLPSGLRHLLACSCATVLVSAAVSSLKLWSGQARLLLLCAPLWCRTPQVRRHDARQPHRRCGSSGPCKPQALRPSQPSWAQPACMHSTAETASSFHYSASTFVTSLLDKDTHAGMGDTLSDSNCDCVYDGHTQIHV